MVSLLAANCLAQSAASSSAAQHSHRREMPGGERSMKGCLSKDFRGDYFLLLARGRKVHLTSSGDVSSHVGQQVRLEGAFIDAPQGETKPENSTNNSQSNAVDKQHPVREFRVVKVDVLSTNCPVSPVKTK